MQCLIPNSINIKAGISFMQTCLTSTSFTLANTKENIGSTNKILGIWESGLQIFIAQKKQDRDTEAKGRIEIKVDMCRRRKILLSLSIPRICYGSLQLFQNSWQFSQYANNVELGAHVSISLSQFLTLCLAILDNENKARWYSQLTGWMRQLQNLNEQKLVLNNPKACSCFSQCE